MGTDGIKTRMRGKICSLFFKDLFRTSQNRMICQLVRELVMGKVSKNKSMEVSSVSYLGGEAVAAPLWNSNISLAYTHVLYLGGEDVAAPVGVLVFSFWCFVPWRRGCGRTKYGMTIPPLFGCVSYLGGGAVAALTPDRPHRQARVLVFHTFAARLWPHQAN